MNEHQDAEPAGLEVGDLIDESSASGYHHDPYMRELQRLKKGEDARRRGYDFEEFIASLFRQRHFQVTLNAGTARPRQTDLLATRGGDAYVVETKWYSRKANIADVDALFTRLNSAPDAVVGLIVSFNGFTETAIKRTEEKSARPVLLLTGEELERIVRWGDDIAHLLARKKTFLLAHREALIVPSASTRAIAPSGRLANAQTEFAFPDGTRTKWIAGKGDFGQFAFVQELPDIDWDAADGRGVTLDMPVPVSDESEILNLLQHLSSMGWASHHARWSIQQSSTNWHGLGASSFAEALTGWQERYKGIETHHSEEFCYFDRCEDGFYCLTAKMSAHESRSAHYAMLSFQLTGVPLDVDPYKELSRTFDTGYRCYFRPMKGKSVRRRWNIRGEYRKQLEPVAFLVEKDRIFEDGREWVSGIVAKNPFCAPESTLAQRKPRWLPSQVFDSELLICQMNSWHPLDDPIRGYELSGCESARTADAVIVQPLAHWLATTREPGK